MLAKLQLLSLAALSGVSNAANGQATSDVKKNASSQESFVIEKSVTHVTFENDGT